MDEQYHLKIEEMKKDFENLMIKKIDEERKSILNSILKIVPDIDKDKVMDAINNKSLKKQNKEKGDGVIDVLDFVGPKGDDFIFRDAKGKLFNQKAELIGFMDNEKYVFYSNGENIDEELEIDEKKIEKIRILK